MTPTIESLQAELAEVNVAVAKLTGKVNAYEEATKPKQPVTARVAIGEVYLYINGGEGDVDSDFEQNHAVDQYRFDTGNYASDTPEGRAYLERKQRRDLAKVHLERKRDELGGFVTAGREDNLAPCEFNGMWSYCLTNSVGEFAFAHGKSDAMREFLSSMSADLDIYFGETV